MTESERGQVRFSLMSLFWATAGIGFLLEHLINAPDLGDFPSVWRLLWIAVFLITWCVTGHFFFLQKF